MARVNVRGVASIPVRPRSFACEGRLANLVNFRAYKWQAFANFALGGRHAIYRIAMDCQEGAAGSLRLFGVVDQSDARIRPF